MEVIYILLAFIQSIGVSLGVGASTLAVLNYLVALKDGNIDPSERKLMHTVYTVLRVAMGVILATLFLQGALLASTYGVEYFRPFVIFAWIIVIVLYLNAVLMTKHLMPRSIGPSLQASSWYTLAGLYFLSSIGATHFSYTEYFIGYLSVFILALVVINGALAYAKMKMK